MLTEICAEIHNYFCQPEKIKSGTFTITNGSIEPLSFLQDRQYYRIVGSVFNDGVRQYGVDTDLTDETFDGEIWPMSVPAAVIALDAEIAQWAEDNADVINSPYQSESFGGYSYSKGTGSGDSNATAGSWQAQFGSRLSPYRKLREM